MLTTAMFFLWMSLRQPEPPKVDPNAGKVVVPNADPLLRDGPLPPVEAEIGGAFDAEGAVDPALADPALTETEQPVRPNHPSQVVTLGSMDPAQGYNMLVTLSTRGAGVERTELVARKKNGGFVYRALEHEGGYAGYLGVIEASNGLRIRSLPDGSPAALAVSPTAPGGLQVDDVLLEFAGRSLDSLAALETALKESKPGQEVEVRVERRTNGQAQTLVYTITLTEAPLDVLRMRPFESEVVEGNLARPSLRTSLASLEGTRIPTGLQSLPALRETLEIDWEVLPLEVEGGQGVEFRLPLDSFLVNSGRPPKLDLVKRYRLLPAGGRSDGFILDMETVVVNRNDKEVSVSLRQEGLAGLTLEGWWYSVKISPSFFSGAGSRDVAYANEIPDSHAIKTSREIHTRALKNPSQPDLVVLSENEPIETRNLKYLGLDAQYFNASILPHPEQPQSLGNLRQAAASAVANVNEVPKSKSQGTNASFWFDTQDQVIPAGGDLSQRYHVFIGPKDNTILAAHGLDEAIEYGWFPLVAKPLGYILHFFYQISGNYGLAIVMLTVCVRGAMFPLGRKAAMNAQRMTELQPELAKINEKYKDNMEKRAKAMQELYAKHNFKPLAGCLPMFIQLPIFIGLYRCLSVDISLRQAALIPGLSWCSNLAGPDQLLDWSSWMPDFLAGRGTGWLGPYFNILPMVTVGLFLLQQKILMPKATDEQTRMTQNMMQIMTVFMGVLFFKVPSGLCIYFITSSLWSLVERKLIKRITPAKPLISDGGSSGSGGSGGGADDTEPAKPKGGAGRKNREPIPEKPKSRFQEMVQMLEKPAVKSSTQRGTRKDKRRRRPNP